MLLETRDSDGNILYINALHVLAVCGDEANEDYTVVTVATNTNETLEFDISEPVREFAARVNAVLHPTRDIAKLDARERGT